jgi:hypothetical protein
MQELKPLKTKNENILASIIYSDFSHEYEQKSKIESKNTIAKKQKS